MQLKVWDKKIMTPLKCGSTFLTSIYGDLNYTSYIDNELFKYLKIEKVDTMIVRNPVTHLKAAMHQEILGFINTEKLEDLSYNGIEKYIWEYIKKEDSGKWIGTTHWSPYLYKNLYFYWKRNRMHTTIVELDNLTEYLSNKLDMELIHNRTNYGYQTNITENKMENDLIKNSKSHYWIGRDDLMDFIKENFKVEYSVLISTAEKELPYYDAMISNEIPKF
jgi:hypothetical protein